MAPLETGAAGPTSPSPTPLLFRLPMVGTLAERLVDNWKLQSTESNYPEQDFTNILQCGVLFVSNMCSLF